MDMEFTGLRKSTTLISMAIISDTGLCFYAELTDYDEKQVDDWIYYNVIRKLSKNIYNTGSTIIDIVSVKCTTSELKEHLTNWLSQFDSVEFWSDCISYDWVLFVDIFGDAFDIPDNVYYIPFDLCTLFKIKGIDPDISREEFCGYNDNRFKNNAIFDAQMIKNCYNKLQSL